MTLSDTCTPRREALTQGGEEKGSYSYHTHARTHAYTHIQHVHTHVCTQYSCAHAFAHMHRHT